VEGAHHQARQRPVAGHLTHRSARRAPGTSPPPREAPPRHRPAPRRRLHHAPFSVALQDAQEALRRAGLQQAERGERLGERSEREQHAHNYISE